MVDIEWLGRSIVATERWCDQGQFWYRKRYQSEGQIRALRSARTIDADSRRYNSAEAAVGKVGATRR